MLVCRTRTCTLSLRALTALTQPVHFPVAIWTRVFDVLMAGAVVPGTARITTPEQPAGGALGEGALGSTQCGEGER